MRKLVRTVMLAYWPFVIGVALVCAAIIAYLVWKVTTFSFSADKKFFAIVYAPIILLMLIAIGQLLWSLMALAKKPPTGDIEAEISFQGDALEPLIAMVKRVAKKRKVNMPDEIKLHPSTVAYVRQGEEGEHILVVGGMGLTAIPASALAGVIAHELGHIASGDTEFGRKLTTNFRFISHLETQYSYSRISKWNPLVWLIRLYHWLIIACWAEMSRQNEFAADQHEVELVGDLQAAATLVYMTIPEALPYVRYDAIVKSHVATGQPLPELFQEQRARIKSLTKGDWDDALKKCLKVPTRWNDSHPALKERLKAIGIKPKRALETALEAKDPPLCESFPAWMAIERKFTKELVRRQQMIQQDLNDIHRIVTAWD